MKKTIQEHAHEIPVVGEYDVVICGGGPAGVAAAIASARAGASTILIESQGCLGGTWTSGCLSWILDHSNKPGLMKEILDRLELLNGRAIHDGVPTNAFDIEKMKLLLETLCIESGVEIRLNTFLAGAICSGSRLTHAITESKSGRQAFAGKVFIDCTGDGDLAARAGCGFDMGHPETGAMQPMSLLALVAGIEPEAVRPFFRYAVETAKVEVCERLRKEMKRGGHSSSHAMPGLFWICEDLFGLAANHEYGVRGTDTADLTHATIDARKEIHSLVNALRSLGGVWGRLHLVATASQIGVREGRRIHGQYMITMDDMTRGVRHPDAVCTVTFPIDVHATDPVTGKTFLNDPASVKKIQPYDIPLRALISRDVDGLMMAGRCISGDFLAHASYRVTGNAVAMGEAAGRVAARTASEGHCYQYPISNLEPPIF